MINIVGSGLAGLSAAINLAYRNISCNLISVQESNRAQSVMAEGGINVRMAIQGIKEISLIIGIDEQDFERAIRLLYEFARAKNKELRP
ncbi:MAG: FAD-binding protein [Erysipelotrichaceae bacterium]|nr:FAD-binding protein [Erysipelotrichaceae bacterium]